MTVPEEPEPAPMKVSAFEKLAMVVPYVPAAI
jgi:hypothetical protein